MVSPLADLIGGRLSEWRAAEFAGPDHQCLVEQAPLLEVLESKHIAGAALDVFEDEFTPGFSLSDNKLWLYFCKNDNLIITPHIGGSTKDAWRLTEEFTINRVVDFLTKHK